MRWELYLQIKQRTKDRKEHYLTKNEMKNIMNTLDLYKIRQQVFDLFEIPVPHPDYDPPHEILKRAHHTYIIDTDFDCKIRDLKQSHEDFLAARVRTAA